MPHGSSTPEDLRPGNRPVQPHGKKPCQSDEKENTHVDTISPFLRIRHLRIGRHPLGSPSRIGKPSGIDQRTDECVCHRIHGFWNEHRHSAGLVRRHRNRSTGECRFGRKHPGNGKHGDRHLSHRIGRANEHWFNRSWLDHDRIGRQRLERKWHRWHRLDRLHRQRFHRHRLDRLHRHRHAGQRRHADLGGPGLAWRDPVSRDATERHIGQRRHADLGRPGLAWRDPVSRDTAKRHAGQRRRAFVGGAGLVRREPVRGVTAQRHPGQRRHAHLGGPRHAHPRGIVPTGTGSPLDANLPVSVPTTNPSSGISGAGSLVNATAPVALPSSADTAGAGSLVNILPASALTNG